jgi:chromosome partitioning protein
LKKSFVPVVAVLNMKGGVGKTTLSAHLFRVLFEQKRIGTLLLDLDPQFNLTQALHTRARYDRLKASGKTIYTVMEPSPHVSIFEIKTSAKPPPLADSLVFHFMHFDKAVPPVTLDLLAGDFDMVKYSLMDDNKKLSAVRKRFASFVEKSKESYGLICIDCNPSSSFLTMCALDVCTHIVVPVRPDRYSILGLEVLWGFVHDFIPITPKPEFIIVLNGVPKSRGGAGTGLVEAELRGHEIFGKRTLASVLRLSALLEAKANYTGFATDRRVPWSKELKSQLLALSDELSRKLGIKP